MDGAFRIDLDSVLRLFDRGGSEEGVAHRANRRRSPVDLTFRTRQEAHLLRGHGSPRQNRDQKRFVHVTVDRAVAHVEHDSDHGEIVQKSSSGDEADVAKPHSTILTQNGPETGVHFFDLTPGLARRDHPLHMIPALIAPAIVQAEGLVDRIHRRHDHLVQMEADEGIDDKAGKNHEAGDRTRDRKEYPADDECVARIHEAEEESLLKRIEAVQTLLHIGLRQLAALTDVKVEILREEELVHTPLKRRPVLTKRKLDACTCVPLRNRSENEDERSDASHNADLLEVLVVNSIHKDAQQVGVGKAENA